MNTSQYTIYLYEALELRNEYQARLASLKALLPEHRQVRRGFLKRDDGERREPAAGFDPAKIRENIRGLEYKSRSIPGRGKADTEKQPKTLMAPRLPIVKHCQQNRNSA